MTNVSTVDAPSLKAWLESGEAVLVDVRTPEEFSGEHIPHALSIPLDQLDSALLNLAKESRKLVFQCQLGKRGESACAVASGGALAGKPIYNLTGGISAWKQAGFPTVFKGEAAPKISIMRQVQIVVGALVLASVVAGYAWLAAIFGAALMFAGLSGWCGLAMLLAKMPWNRR